MQYVDGHYVLQETGYQAHIILIVYSLKTPFDALSNDISLEVSNGIDIEYLPTYLSH